MNKKIGNTAQICSARRVMCTEGKEDGIRLIEVSNGVLNFTLSESNALDVAQLFYKGMNMSFISRNGLVSKEVPFLNYFPAGMVYTCGLDAVGGKEGCPVHGSLHHTPAKIESIVCNEEGVTVTAETADTQLFGKGLHFRRTVSTKSGEGRLHIHDELTNDNFRPEDYYILYHINVGYPMLDAGSKIIADVSNTVPRDETAAKIIDRCFDIDEPIDNAGEACYFHEMNKAEISLVNEKIGRKFTVRYSKDTLPELTEWKAIASGDFALGFEPSITKLDNILPKTLAPGEKVVFDVELEISEI